MTAAVGMLVPRAAEDSHFPPTPESFWQPLFKMFSVGGEDYYFTRPMALMAISAVAIIGWLLWSTRKAAVVPGKPQAVTEYAYNFVRNDIARDMIGSKEFMRFVPLLFALFLYILLNNFFGALPPFQNPTAARIGFPIALVIVVYLAYHWVGIKKHGLMGYFGLMVPKGIPSFLKVPMFLLEAMTFFITRPLTLALRLFGNMFAGHMLLVVFIVGGWVMFTQDDILLKFVAIPAWIMGAVLTIFEMLIQFVQAYVFTLLAASYFADSVADEH